MIVSTKGRYALRVMLHFALSGNEQYIPLKEIAESEEISQKYLESIMTTLSKAGFVDAVHGKGGGYRLNRKPEEYTVGSILKLTEGSLATVSCTSQGPAACSRSIPWRAALRQTSPQTVQVRGKNIVSPS